MIRMASFLLMLSILFASESIDFSDNGVDLFTPKTSTKTHSKRKISVGHDSSGSFVKNPHKLLAPGANGNNINKKNTKIIRNATPDIYNVKGSFTRSIAILSLFFDNGVQKSGYGVLLKNGYIITTANLVREMNSYIKTIQASMQSDDVEIITCAVNLRPKALGKDLVLLEPISYTDKYCNVRPKSFFHQRVIVKYAKKLDRDNTINNLILRDSDLLLPYIDKNFAIEYKKIKISSISTQKIEFNLPVFLKNGEFVGFINDKNNILTSNYINNFICNITSKKLIDISDLNRDCL